MNKQMAHRKASAARWVICLPYAMQESACVFQKKRIPKYIKRSPPSAQTDSGLLQPVVLSYFLSVP